MRLGLACCVLLAGCDLFFEDPHPQCALDQAPEIAANTLRDPDSGLCESFGSPCLDPCAVCEAGDLAPPPDWASCESSCDGLPETACATTPGCRTVYNAHSDTDQGPEYLECWSIAPSGPAEGACAGLDAYECSRHQDCGAYYDNTDGDHHDPSSPLVFSDCRAEGASCTSSNTCDPGQKCSTEDGDCFPPPGCGPGVSCPAVCTGVCVRL